MLGRLVHLVATASTVVALVGCGDGKARGAGGSGASASSGSASGSGGIGGESGSSGGGGSSASGGTTGSGGVDAGGCTAPPPLSFDPLAGYVAPPLTATMQVTSAADSGPGSLRAVIAAAADGVVVGFDPSLAGKSIVLSTPIELSKSVTLTGQGVSGVTLDGQGQTQIIHFNGDAPIKIAFFGLRFQNGHTQGSGGAISVNGGAINLEIGGCTFDGNSGDEGGAVRAGYAKGTAVFLHDSLFTNNDGSVPGNGNGFSGGALSITGTNLRITRCRFEKNQGPTTGAVYTIHSDPIVEDSVFVENKTSRPDGGSGAFFADGGGPGDDNNPGQIPGQVTIRRSRFEQNHGAGTDGGAMLIWGYPEDVITLDSSILRGNQCPGGGKGGGARLHARNKLVITRTAFVDNVSDQQGGGVWVDGEGPFELTNLLFSGNQASGDRGGGATLNIAGPVKLVNVTFVENAAKNGCGAFWLPGKGLDVHLLNSIIAGNTGANGWEVQTGYAPMDDGGNIEFPLAGAGDPAAVKGLHEDPKLGPVTEMNGMLVRALTAGSPAVDLGVADGAPSVDIRGAKRDGKPDCGSFEVGGACGP